MKFVKYTKYVADAAGEMSLEDLLNALSDYLLESGFQNPYLNFYEMQGEHTMEELRRAIEEALARGDLLDQEMQQRLQQMRMEGTLEQLIEKLGALGLKPKDSPELQVSAAEFVLEGLYAHKRIGRSEERVFSAGEKTVRRGEPAHPDRGDEPPVRPRRPYN